MRNNFRVHSHRLIRGLHLQEVDEIAIYFLLELLVTDSLFLWGAFFCFLLRSCPWVSVLVNSQPLDSPFVFLLHLDFLFLQYIIGFL